MRRKQLYGMLLSLLILLEVFSGNVFATEYGRFNNVDNPGFEEVDILGNPAAWKFGNSGIGKGMYLVEEPENVHNGRFALKMQTESTETWISAEQTIYGGLGGETYTFSFWMKIAKMNTRGVAIKAQFGDGTYIQPSFKDAPIGEWAKQSFTFTLPEGTDAVYFLLRLWDGGEVYFDDVSIMGRFDKEKDVRLEIEPADPILPEVSKDKELFIDGDFEDLTEDGIGLKAWGAYKGWSAKNTFVTISQEDPYSGENCVMIATDSGGNPWVSQAVADIEEETEYQFSMWYKTETSKASKLGVKLEYYTENAVNADYGTEGFENSKLQYAPLTGGQWQQYTATFTTPKNCKCVALYPRFYTNGIVKIDKVSLYKIDQKRIKLDTDEVFYYTERETPGVATAVPNTRHYTDLGDKTVSFALKDGETVIDETKPIRLGDGAKYTFPVSALLEEQKDYTLSASLYDTDGTLLETQSQTISRWPRPSVLTADGKYMVDGEVFVPLIGYGVASNVESFRKAKEIGVNVVQYVSTANAKVAKSVLDAASEAGVKVLACMYGGMIPAGHPDKISQTEALMEVFKDHEAIFAYALLDEPQMQWNNNDLDNVLQESYKIIRKYDKDRPVYLCESSTNWQGYKQTAKYCDIFALDPYINSDEELVSRVESHIKMAQEAVGYRKPVIPILNVGGSEAGRLISVDNIQHETYRALMLGTMGTGLFTFKNSYRKADGTAVYLYDSGDFWDGWKNYYETEYKSMIEDFVLEPKPIYSDIKADDYYARSYIKDGKITLVLLNRSAEEKSVSVPLISADGTLSVGGFSAKAIGKDAPITGNRTLEWKLTSASAEVFEITPEETMDFSHLKPSRFADLEGYPWARTQIDTLDAHGVVNEKTYKSFAPGENISRGDFAYFLIRTLGLTSDASANFDDVDANAYYAKEVAIGKNLGILKGTGDNIYNPESAISRQDLMVICSRAMELAPSTDEISFSDKALIADYAMADVAAMVRENIIKGNADGTINPLGNTTRAEAAVIMHRVDTWNKAP